MPKSIQIKGLDAHDATACKTRPFFARGIGRQFDVKAADSVTVIDLYDEIGFWGVTAASFREQLNAIKSKSITLRINSPGGDVFDGIAMYNDLVSHSADVSVEITGLAASAAAVIAMAGDEISIAENAFLMIHNAWGITIGDRRDHMDASELLLKIDGVLAETFAARADIEPHEAAQLMDDESWFSGAEAVEIGLADTVAGEVENRALFDLSGFHNVPQALPTFAVGRREQAPTRRDAEKSLRDAGFSRSQAKQFVGRAYADKSADSLRDAGALDTAERDALSSLTETIKGVTNHVSRQKPKKRKAD